MENIIFMSDIKKKAISESKQIQEKNFSVKVIDYPYSVKYLSLLRSQTWLLKWAINKISIWANTKLLWDTSEKLSSIKDVMITYWTKNIKTTWNAWFEVIRRKNWEVSRLIPVVSDTIRLICWWTGALQKIWAQEVYFNLFEADEDIKKQWIEVYNNSGAGATELSDSNTDSSWRLNCGYNPNLNEVLFIKTANVDNNYYGECELEWSIVDQAILLKWIDDYYIKFFEKWTMKTTLIYDKSWKLTQKEKQFMKTEFDKKSRWLENSFNSIVITADLDMVQLDADVEPNSFNEYRKNLRQEMLASLNVPYDMMFNESSSRNSLTSALTMFNDYTIKPMQRIFLKELKEISRTYNNGDIDETLQLSVFDTYNSIEEQKSLSEAVKSWWMTPNEARAESNYNLEDNFWWDVLLTPTKEEVVELEKMIKT